MLYLNLIHLGLITLPKTELVQLQPSHARLGTRTLILTKIKIANGRAIMGYYDA